MSGVKGKSGGARENSGGYRPGSGPQKKPPLLLKISGDEPLEFLLAVMRNDGAPVEVRMRAAVAAARIEARVKGGGKKVEKADAAKDAASGRLAPGAPPRLVASSGG